MRWLTLWKQIGKLPVNRMKQRDVYAVLYDHKSHTYVKRWLMLKYDANGNPYLVEDHDCTLKHRKEQEQKFRRPKQSENRPTA